MNGLRVRFRFAAALVVWFCVYVSVVLSERSVIRAAFVFIVGLVMRSVIWPRAVIAVTVSNDSRANLAV